MGVVYHFHGDGAFEYESPQYTASCLAEVAREHNMLLVVPRTPDRAGEITWWEERDLNAQWFLSLVEERLEPEYDIDRFVADGQRLKHRGQDLGLVVL